MGKTDKPFPQLVSLPDPPTNQPTNQGGFTKDFWTHQPSTSRFTKVLSLDHLGGACRVGGRLLGAQKEGFLHGALPRVTLHTSLFFWFQGFYTENFDRNHLEDRRYQIYQRVLYVLKGLTFFIYGRYSSSKRKHHHFWDRNPTCGGCIFWNCFTAFPWNFLLRQAEISMQRVDGSCWSPRSLNSTSAKHSPSLSSRRIPIRGKDLVAMKILQWGCWAHLM